MPPLSKSHITALLSAADKATTNNEKGRALEELVCHIFGQVPGITIVERNQLNAFHSEEIDIAFWNTQDPLGLYFLPHIVLVECKNWSHPLASNEVSWFDSKLMRRAQHVGILVAANGITGDPEALTSSHNIVGSALQAGRQLVVITREEIETLTHTSRLVEIIERKLCQLAVLGTSLLPAPAA